jgi:nucleotide-binding universal stress UspA family protein
MTDGNDYTIAVGLDGSDSSWKAFSEAVLQAKLRKAILHVVSIQEEIEASYSANEILAAENTERHKLERLQIKARLNADTEGVVSVTAIAIGHSANAMIDYVKKNTINLLVIGDTGHSSIWGALLGTSAERIVRGAPCCVLVVR